jgi:hypothetical protein
MLQVRCSTSRHIAVDVSMRCGVHTQFQNSNRMRAATRSRRTRFLAVKAAARCAAQAPAVLHADRAGGANAGHDHGRTSSREGHPVRENRAEGTAMLQPPAVPLLLPWVQAHIALLWRPTAQSMD